MLRLAILLRPLAGVRYLPGDLVHVLTESEVDGKLRITHVLAAREHTDGAWAQHADFVYAPAGTRKDDLRLALACHRIARHAGDGGDGRAVAEAAMLEAFGPDALR